MKYYTLINSDDGYIVEEINGRSCSYCNSAFIYKDDNGVYHLVDKESGLSICRNRKMKNLEESFNEIKSSYYDYKKTDAYKIKVKRFEKMKLSYNYKGVK